MKTSELLAIIKTSLTDDNVYRTDAFLLERLNDGYKLTSLFTLFDERRVSLAITGVRNFFAMPKSGTDICIAPLYLADGSNGRRVHPCQLDQFEYYKSGWEGDVSSSHASQYVVLSPFNYAHAAIVVCPIADTGSVVYNMIGAFIPATLTVASDTQISDAHVDILLRYTRFAAFITEPGRAEDAVGEYKLFTEGLAQAVMSLRSRFPSGRDYEPFPLEFIYDTAPEEQNKVVEPKGESNA